MRKREERRKMISPPLTSVRAGLNYQTTERGYFNVSLVVVVVVVGVSLSKKIVHFTKKNKNFNY